MNKEIIPHVFATVMNLERYFGTIIAMIRDGSPEQKKLSSELPQIERIIKNMRQAANKLQFELAGNNEKAALRSLQIFYGLNHMVRPEILAAHRLVNNGIHAANASKKSAPAAAVIH